MSPILSYKNNELFIENVGFSHLASRFGTPSYIYSEKQIEKNWELFSHSFKNHPHLICYAVKANSNLSILNLLAKRNSGFDIVSLGELERVLAAGGDSNKIIFSGVGKQTHEILKALEVNIKCFNVESESELLILNDLAKQQNKVAPIALRINPNIDAKTHPHIATGLHENKFGIPLEQIPIVINKLKFLTNVKLIGLACHIGSQLMDLTPISDAIDCLMNLAAELAIQGFQLKHINIGGGLGISYQHEPMPTVVEYAKKVLQQFSRFPQYEIVLEPGRAMIANTGVLLTKILYLKQIRHKNFAIVDAAINDLIRPALYESWHEILPVKKDQSTPLLYDIVGPICESSDYLGKKRLMALSPHHLLAICDTGAYGFSMSSNYNSRPRAAEILVNGNDARLIRQRETIEDLYRHEKCQ